MRSPRSSGRSASAARSSYRSPARRSPSARARQRDRVDPRPGYLDNGATRMVRSP
jgi:hypothetical protein